MWPFGAKKSPVPSTLSSYARRRAQAKAELQKKIAILDKEVIDLQESMQITQCEIESFEEEVKRKADICEPTHPLHNPEELVKLHQEIARTSYELADKKKIDEQEEQYLGSDEELSDPEEEEMRKLRKEFQDWKSGCGVSAPTIKDGYSHAKSEFISNPTSAMDSIVQSLQTQNQALMKVLRNNQPSQSLTDKLLVRQSIGRDLPLFSGRPEEWPSFIATFKRTTSSCGFTDAENVERIRKCLRGDAAKSVECLLVSPQSLPKVLQILEEKFGQSEVIIRSMVAKAKVVPSVKEEKPQTMIDFGTTVVNLVATIKNLGELEHLRNPVLTHELVEKLPSHFRISWEESVVALTHKSTLEDFAEWVEARVKIACRMCPPKPAENPSKKEENKKSHAKEAKETEEGMCTTAGLFSGQDKKIPCPFCKKTNHMGRDCYRAEKMTWEEKSKVLREGRLCFRCFTSGHRKDSCKVKIKCAICNGPHVKSMCAELPSNQRRIRNEEVHEEEHAVNTTANNSNHTCRGDVLLKTVVVRAIGPKGSSLVRLLFDEGSQLSNIGSATVNKIGSRQVGEEWSRSVLFGGDVTQAKKVKKFEVKLESLDGKFSEKLVLNETPVICGTLPRIPHGPWVQELKKKKIWISDLEQRSLESTDVEILVGSDYWGKLVTSKPLQVFQDLNAVKTKFGWTLSGPLSRKASQASVADLWDLETIGIRDPAETKTKEENDREAKESFIKTISRKEDGRYVVSLPWLGTGQEIPNNKTTAEKRLVNATNKLSAKVSDTNKKNKCYYLPHRPVFKPDSLTTPVRPVFDASCKTGRAPSLNESLEKGPNLMELIPSILLRFREKKIGAVSDIRKAFQMIEVKEEDRDFLRFLWWEDATQEKLKELRHKRVVFGVNCSPFILAAVLEKHLKSVKEDLQPLSSKLLGSLYVDNCVTSLDTFKEYENFKTLSTEILKDAKKDLRQWKHTAVGTSGIEFNPYCGLDGDSDGAPKDSSFKTTTMVLGLVWDKEEDTLTCKIKNADLPDKLTKREILSRVPKIYDPIGFTSPATLQPKILLQDAWAQKLEWDKELPQEMQQKFTSWCEEIQCLAKIKIPRWALLSASLLEDLQFHVFCDASQVACASVVYVRIGEKVQVHLLQAKSRVAPLKKMTIPRLELLGCTIAARMMKSVADALSLDGVTTTFWTDSTTALAWIQRNDDWGTFVGNRVRSILKLTSAENWRHVPGVLNPADLPSRGCDSRELLESKWWEGPDWLKEEEDKWPTREVDQNEAEVAAEKKATKTQMTTSSQVAESWYLKRFSSFKKNVRVIGWRRRFVENARTSSQARLSGPLQIEEINNAEKCIIKMIQKEVFGGVNPIGGMETVVDEDGIIRVVTKLFHCQEPEGFRRPMLLPKSHPAVEMLIRESHLENSHAGAQFLMGKLREEYWILQGRQAIKKVISSCVRCRRFSAKEPTVPRGQLPDNRVKMGKVFEVIGVDYAGPLYLKDKSKVWFCLFTCAVYRCVHLEVVNSLSTEAFIMTLDRFIARRGRPSVIYSDNGTNFVGAVNLFKNIDWSQVEKETETKRIKWIFNPPSSPWWGGWWERLVKTVKDLIKRMLGNARLNFEQLSSCLCSVEATVNGRPLTFVTEDPMDLIPITPAMFIQDVQDTSYPELGLLDGDILRKKNQDMQVLRGQLRERFRKEYLSQLVQRGSEKGSRQFKINELVLVGSDNKKRVEWPLGRIIELMAGKDDKVRVARGRTRTGIFVRPLQRLYSLEISDPVTAFPELSQDAKKEEQKSKEKIEAVVRTKKGREVKKPHRYGKCSDE
ncbi:uncharacterized protein LOC110855152 [Folsomia candida]|uniref:uncharacterized protein LOC110855152 n=1 Tax=Folsomia candida TaxID=158441 RepID=UPI000B8FC621|nr:uncharacterized protein LOC110855152 [Folsomia candida]